MKRVSSEDAEIVLLENIDDGESEDKYYNLRSANFYKKSFPEFDLVSERKRDALPFDRHNRMTLLKFKKI